MKPAHFGCIAKMKLHHCLNRRSFAVLLGIILLSASSAPGQAAMIAIQGSESKTVQEKAEQTKDSAGKADTKSTIEPSLGVTFGDEVRNNWRVGVKVRAGSQSVKGMMVTLPVPTDWPEQEVTLVEENFPSDAKKIKYRVLDNGIRQIVAELGTIRPGDTFEMSATFQVRTLAVKGPEDTTIFKIPKGLPKDIKDYIGNSPQITFRNNKLRKQVKAIVKEHPLAWDQAEAIHLWIRENIQHETGKPKDSLDTLRDKKGSAEDLNCLFVAMCRCIKIPARMVWVDGTQYTEFYLMDEEKNGYWFPVQTAGLAEFGSMSNPRIILEKGDNFKVPEKKDRQKFVREFAKGSGKVKPKLRFTRDLLPAR